MHKQRQGPHLLIMEVHRQNLPFQRQSTNRLGPVYFHHSFVGFLVEK
jgi:hypothetical protein